ncbi:MAG: LytTR family DNA-binding domain-containing protein [Bacteroidota bacterium]|nr:LytTR family DNA-binding domain-containing protein [Bacteroidota bacterium]
MQQQLTYISVDDDELDRLHVEAMASSFSFLQKIGACDNAVEGFEMISFLKPDIVFADIEMPGISGICMVQKLAGEVPAPVFITSHPEFALDGFELQVFDYLLKPVSSERFEKCALRLKDFFELRNNAFAFVKEEEHNYIVIKQGHDKYKLPLDDIVYLEAMRDYTKLVTASKNYLVLETFSKMLQQLPPEKFVRIHRSYIVNKTKIDAVQKNKINILSEELPVGKLYKHALLFTD